MIGCAPRAARAGLEKKVYELIQAGLANPNIEVQKAAAEMIRCAPKDARKNIFQLAKRKKVGNVLLVEPPLYNKGGEISKEAFQRTKFPKTGSETTLIGGNLKGKTIIRHLMPTAFLTWQKLYEDYPLWRREGFDYVPIEPIQSYRLNQKGLVDVYSGVLDLNLSSWKEMTDDFARELDSDRNKIVSVLDKQDIRHGHTNNGNFCLRFFRDKNGNVDFNKKPRLYLIDFDQAVSPPE